ncbi:MAG: hypothetical protein KBF62_02585 [Candidatus Pacebacteria bacterium]|jgi:hypothetical protein|nr:hypothetical protein [Candidatus Paceibacterota bacterium]MBP9058502.1 hypothetical protein [Candidatus Paceibacterota bacterium]MBP9770405.1 hypothetical protein [Candidatus Paceibacterota bacterium]
MYYIIATALLITFGIFYFISDKKISKNMRKIKSNFIISYDLKKLVEDSQKQRVISEILIAIIFSIISAIITSTLT